MNRDQVRRSIAELGYDARLEDAGSKLIVEFAVLGRTVTLAHTFPDNLLRVPKFYLLKGHGFGKLAHVLTNENDEGGEVCIADPSSTAVNADRPELAYRVTVEKHVCLLKCQRRSKISPPGRSKTSPLNVMRYAVLGGCPGSP